MKRAKGENEFKEEEYLVRDKKQKEGRQRKTGTRQNKGENIKGNLKKMKVDLVGCHKWPNT